MAHLVENSFSSYKLTEAEEFEGSVLFLLQKQCIQNEIALHAEMKLALELDTKNVDKFIQEEASLSAKILILQWLIEKSDAAEKEAKFRAQNPVV